MADRHQGDGISGLSSRPPMEVCPAVCHNAFAAEATDARRRLPFLRTWGALPPTHSRKDGFPMSNYNALIQRQRDYFATGATRPLEARLDALRQLKNAIRKSETDIIHALHSDLGKSEFEAFETEVGFVLAELSHTIKHLRRWCEPREVETPRSCAIAHGSIRYEPLGVCLVISPWNYPFQLSMAPVIAAISAGDCVVLKPSEYAGETARVIERLIAETLDPGWCTVVQGGREASEGLLAERFDHIFFTGSPEVGKAVLRAAAEHLTPVTLELGGKSPCIVDESADIDLAAKRIAWGKFLNAGQTCVAPDYLYLHDNIREDFLKSLVKWTKTFWGENALRHPDLPHIVNRRHFDRLMGLFEEEQVLHGGQSDPQTLQIAPTILTDIDPESPIMQQEIFGPLLPILPYHDLDTVIREINARPKPLALYLFANYQVVVKKVMESVSFGGGCINDTIMHLCASELPFGGVGNSGMGRYHGRSGFETFSNPKSVLKRSNLIDPGLRYMPYTEKKGRKIRKYLK